MTPEEAFAARRAVMAEIEKESLDKTGLRSDVVTLYQGGQYHLYRYKKYTDVRLVFAPGAADRLLRRRSGQLRVSALRSRHLLLPRLRERQAGQDRALPEVEQGRREGRRAGLRLRPSRAAPTGSNTVADLEYLRDIGYPFLLQRLNRLRGDAVDRSAAAARRTPGKAKELLFGVAEQPQGARSAAWPACSTRR